MPNAEGPIDQVGAELTLEPAPAWRLSRRTVTVLVSLGVGSVLFGLTLFVPVPYVTMRPGPTFDTLGDFDDRPMIEFGDDVEVYPTDGQFDFTTVSVTRPESTMTLGTALRAWLNPDVAVVSKKFVYPDDATNEQNDEAGAAEMSSSKDDSRAAALRAAGFEVPELAVVAQVAEDAPALGVLQAGDILLAVDRTEIESVAHAGQLIADRDPGDEVSISFSRNGEQVTETIVTEPNPDSPERPRIGIWITVRYDFPLEVTNNVGDSIGGPSAGLMFAVAIYDRLTPGALAGGRHFAGTGTIDGEGLVGGIGGVRQKIVGARKGGAEFFFVPAENCDEATAKSIDGIRLVKATELDDVLESVEALARDPRAKVPTCP